MTAKPVREIQEAQPWEGDNRVAPTAAPCPFCGCSCTIIETVEVSDPEPIYHAECWRCGARGPVEDANDKALRSWNVRIRQVGIEQFRCWQCGAGVAADEDGCCANCGVDCEVIQEAMRTGEEK